MLRWLTVLWHRSYWWIIFSLMSDRELHNRENAIRYKKDHGGIIMVHDWAVLYESMMREERANRRR